MAIEYFVMIAWLLSASVRTSRATWCPDGYRLGTGTMDGVCHLASCLNLHSERISLRDNGTTVSHCKEPTRSFVHCPNRIRVSDREYGIVDDDTRLWIRETNRYVPLGEFVILADGVALVCADEAVSNSETAVSPFLPTMCMPFTLPSSECRLSRDGSLTAVNATFGPGFFQDYGHVQEYAVCYGLSESFVRCAFRGRLPARYSYTRTADMSLYTNLSVVIVYELGSYAWTANRKSSVVCVNAMPPYRVDRVLKLLTEVSMIASALCLLVTAIVHLFFSTTSSNHHTRVLVCHTFSLLVMYVSTTVRFFAPMRDVTDVQCYALFSVSYVATLGSFFWLSVLAHELWRAFSDLRPTVASTSSPGKRRRFLVQCAYAWGIPIGLCIVALNIIADKNLQDLLDLKFPMRHFCWFVDDRTIFVFLYAIVIVVLIVNTVFFLLTVFNVHRASRGTEILNKKVGHQMFKIFVKLFVVMGLFWFAEFFTWLFRTPDSSWPHPIDLINALQGVVIFAIYVVKAKTLRTCRERLGRRRTAGRTSGSWSATTSTSVADGGSSVVVVKGNKHAARTTSADIALSNVTHVSA